MSSSANAAPVLPRSPESSGGAELAGLSVVIPSWNGRALLEKFLPTVITAAAAFEAACHQPTEVLVADDASTDDTIPWLAARFPQVRFEVSQQQQGFAATANRGVQAARYARVYLVNNDVALAPGTLPPLLAHFSDQKVFAVASQVYDYHTGRLSGAGQLAEFRRGFLRIHRRYFVSPEAAQQQPPYLTIFASGGAALFNREKFLALGGFDELLAPFGWEDVELALRAWKRGWRLHYEPRSIVWHQFASTIAPRFSPRYVRAIYERNRLLAHWIHLDAPALALSHTFFLLLKLLGSSLVGRWEVWRALKWTVAAWPQVRARRVALRATEPGSLREILALFAEQGQRAELRPLTPATAPTRLPTAGRPAPLS